MPSLILDDFFGDIKIELQLSHIADVDEKNSEMVNQVFCKMKSMEKEIKLLTGVNEKQLEKMNTLEKSRSGIHRNNLLKEIEDLKIDLNNLQCEYDAERCARAPRLWDELKQEMKKVTSHRDRLLRFHKRDTKKIKEMEEDWEVATEKIANENADLREQIKKLKKEIKEYEIESRESIVANQKVYGEAFAIQAERDRLKKENEALKERIGKKLKSPDTDYKLLFEVGSTNLSRASYDKEFAECAKLFMRGHFDSYEGWINYRHYE